MTDKKPVRVWSCDRKLRYGIVAESWTNLIEKITQKFFLSEKKISVVLEEDGTTIDESYWAALEPHKRLIVLKEDEKWEAAAVPIPNIINYSQDSFDTTDSANSSLNQSPVIRMFIELQKNPAGISLFNLDNLELIKDIDLNKIATEEASYGLDKEFCKVIQDMSIELYVKRKTEADALEFVDLLMKTQMSGDKKLSDPC